MSTVLFTNLKKCRFLRSSVSPSVKFLFPRKKVTTAGMPSNIEIKAKVPDVEGLKVLAASLSHQQPTVINQHDTFFNVSSGRLKLRFLQDNPSQLIFYKRSDSTGPKQSEFCISEAKDPEALKTVLDMSIGVRGEVKKRRLLYIVGQTRVHVDSVEGLGDYMELEVEMREDQTLEEGQQIAESLMKDLCIDKENLVSGAYIDLLEDKSS